MNCENCGHLDHVAQCHEADEIGDCDCPFGERWRQIGKRILNESSFQFSKEVMIALLPYSIQEQP